MYHPMACLTVTKLSYLGEHSEVSQARSLHACWTRMLYQDRLETIDNSPSTNSAKTLKIFNVYPSLGLQKIMSQFFNDDEIQSPCACSWNCIRKTLLLSRSDKRQDFAWNRQQTEWNVLHKLSPSYLQKPAYGSMPLEPAETRPISNFPESRVAFQGTIS